jgi:nucleoside-triphosphatase
MISVYLLTGMPGTGKTSLIRELVKDLGKTAGGFYTEEIRTNGIRQGFRIVTLDGQTSILAYVDIHSPYKVSKYGVDIQALDAIGVPALKNALRSMDVIVIDEIGKMELYSESFKSAVMDVIESGKKTLGTIMLKPDPWADWIKADPRVKIVNLNRSNRNKVMEEMRNWLKDE